MNVICCTKDLIFVYVSLPWPIIVSNDVARCDGSRTRCITQQIIRKSCLAPVHNWSDIGYKTCDNLQRHCFSSWSKFNIILGRCLESQPLLFFIQSIFVIEQKGITLSQVAILIDTQKSASGTCYCSAMKQWSFNRISFETDEGVKDRKMT